MGQAGRRAAAHACAVIKGILLIGFSVQIVLGAAWLCCNFGKIQDFAQSGSVLYQGIFRLFGGIPAVLYLLQLGAAFGAGYRFLYCLGKNASRRGFAVWGSLVLLTFPFAMQCHLALLPCSFQGSLFLLGLSFLLEFPASLSASGCSLYKVKKAAAISLAMVCFCVTAVLYQGMEGSLASRYGVEAALASRMAWPTVWLDRDRWTEDLQEITQDVAWEAGFNPEKMEILCQRIEESVDEETAKSYYLQIAKHAWQIHAPVVIHQIGWDVLGYALSPVIVPLQLQGKAYDSFTGRNYEVMGGSSPVLTKYYVDYGCWWFPCSMALGLSLAACRLVAEGVKKTIRAYWKKLTISVFVCGAAAALLTLALTMRGAGLMDYKSTIAVNELWLAAVLLAMRPTAEQSRKRGV